MRRTLTLVPLLLSLIGCASTDPSKGGVAETVHTGEDEGAAPIVTITSPTDGQVVQVGQVVNFSALVGDPDGSPEDLQVRWESDLNGVLNTSAPNSTGEASFSTSTLSAGLHQISLLVTDPDGLATSVSSTLRLNSLPSTPELSILPAVPRAGQALEGVLSSASIDAEGDPIRYSYSWSVDGLSTPWLSEEVPAGETLRGQEWTLMVVPDDGYGEGEAAMASVVIANSPPEITDLTISPGSPNTLDTLSVVPTVADVDGDTLSFAYAWRVDGILVSTDPTLDESWFSRGQTVLVEVTPHDGIEPGETFSSSPLTIENAAPSLSSVAISPSVATESSTLFCGATGFDPDGDSLDLHYSWRVDGAPVAATTPSLTGTYFNKNQVVICEVMPDDGTSTGPSLSATGVTIQNSPPSAPGISITPSDPEEGLDPLVCAVDTPSNDADGDVLSYVFGWTRNGSAFSGAIPTSATSSTVAVDATLTGDVFVCSVTASDGTDSSSASVDSVEIEGNIYTIGYDTPFPTPETGFAGANYLLGERITVSYPAELFQLGVLLRLASTNSVYLALYRDSGGLPGSLVAYTNVTHLASYGTEVELDVVGGPVNLSVGYYWIMWNFSGATYAGFTTVGAAGNTIAYRNAANSASPPTTFGAATTYTGQHLNLYMVVR